MCVYRIYSPSIEHRVRRTARKGYLHEPHRQPTCLLLTHSRCCPWLQDDPGSRPRRLHWRSQLHDLPRARARRHPGIHPAIPADDHLPAQHQDWPLPRCRPPLPLHSHQARLRRRRRRLALLTPSADAQPLPHLHHVKHPLQRSPAHPRAHVRRPPRVLLGRNTRRRRHRLHRSHPGQSRHGRRPPHRQPSPRLLHQHGPHSPRLSSCRAARAISRQGRPQSLTPPAPSPQ